MGQSAILTEHQLSETDRSHPRRSGGSWGLGPQNGASGSGVLPDTLPHSARHHREDDGLELSWQHGADDVV